MPLHRRDFLKAAGLAAVAAPLRGAGPPPAVRPPRLRPGDVVGLINPAGVLTDAADLAEAREALEALGLRVRVGAHVLDRYGYLAGTDQARAADVHAMFADESVRAVVAVRGGWGCARLLPLLDFDLIGRNPKVLMGYSDITALLLAVYARTGLVTFHGPVGISTWNPFTVESVRRVLFDARPVVMRSPPDAGPFRGGPPSPGPVGQTLRPGVARGRLAGGNLSVLVAMVGSGFLPEWPQHLLFLEEIGEETYRIDRMMTQLRLAGVLAGLSGFVFGKCTDCEADNPEHNLSLEQVLSDHLDPLGIPIWLGAPIGHVSDKLTVPIGVEAELDAAAGTLRLLEPAVV